MLYATGIAVRMLYSSSAFTGIQRKETFCCFFDDVLLCLIRLALSLSSLFLAGEGWKRLAAGSRTTQHITGWPSAMAPFPTTSFSLPPSPVGATMKGSSTPPG